MPAYFRVKRKWTFKDPLLAHSLIPPISARTTKESSRLLQVQNLTPHKQIPAGSSDRLNYKQCPGKIIIRLL